MKYGKLIHRFEQHQVSAAEAAYGALFGIWTPDLGPQWGPAVAEPLSGYLEEWEVQSMEVYLSTATGVELRGRVMTLFAPQRPGVAQETLPHKYVEAPSTRVILSRVVQVVRGVGVYFRPPAVADTNLIGLSFTYRVVHHD